MPHLTLKQAQDAARIAEEAEMQVKTAERIVEQIAAMPEREHEPQVVWRAGLVKKPHFKYSERFRIYTSERAAWKDRELRLAAGEMVPNRDPYPCRLIDVMHESRSSGFKVLILFNDFLQEVGRWEL